MNGRLFALPLLVAAAIGLAACSSPTTGTPSASGGGLPTDGDSTSSQSSPSSGGGGSGTAAVQPCNLLSSAAVGQYQLSSQGPSTGSGARSCEWQNVTADNGLGYALEIDVRDQQGLKDINTGGVSVSDDPIGRHQGKLVKQTSGDVCDVAIGVTNRSRVDVQVNTGNSDVNEACSLANQFAKVVEPELP